MRLFVLLGLMACASALPALDSTPAQTPAESGRSGEVVSDHVPIAARIIAPALSAQELLLQAGVETYIEDRDLRVASIDSNAMERWFRRPPRHVYFYAEPALALAQEGEEVRGQCQRLRRWNSGAVNELAAVLWRRGRLRTMAVFGQEHVTIDNQILDAGEWDTTGFRTLSVGAIAWDDAHIRYAEGAALHEVACVPALRVVSCGGEYLLGPRAYCVDDKLVVRPWRVPMVPHVGPVASAYNDVVPDVPVGDCEVECERSACEEALRITPIPRVPLYTEEDPVLAVFRTRADCRAFAASREEFVRTHNF